MKQIGFMPGSKRERQLFISGVVNQKGEVISEGIGESEIEELVPE